MANPNRRIATAAMLAAIAITASAALATTGGANGQIAFRRYSNPANSAGAVFTMNTDGNDVRQITHPPAGTVDDQPDWSPNGKLLTFFNCVPDSTCSVDIVNADGSGRRQLTRCTHPETPNGVPRGCEDGGDASFTPDCRHVTFTRATGHVKQFPKLDTAQIEHSAIAIIGVDGRGEREILRLAPYSGDANWPQMSPDGKLVLFERSNSPTTKPRFGLAMFVLDSDGTHVHRVTPWSLHAGDNADWAPNGSRILFRSHVDVNGKQSQYYTVRPDGSGLAQLTHFARGTKLFSASYSPDGRQIVYGQGDAKGRGDIWTMDADGTNQRPLLRAADWDSAADWGAGR